ncbi:phosphatidylglycerophosphatase [Mesocricetibacter intestinalis]|uniref:Phosphatidylglycerophosphatase A n=1 Tax=Mesocricetibacter intestinalis TaxID=1521930 RepID=A0A4R6VBH0_9PAST|nr:phosphatidylglycerophosphatase A [Mesocricetibacter intestinalis]TDQ57418.1 phosphatidylglycerophosphatase [Mesocricetibacter intestinalis]
MTDHQNPLRRLSLRNPVHFLALGLGSGLISPAPGTWGSLAGLVIGALLLSCLGQNLFLILTALCFVLGCYLCQKTADDMGVHDHGAIVWDEFVGIFLVLSALPELSPLWLALGFILFRLFDITKPYPIRYFDRKLRSGFGIMIDDLLAACFSIVPIVILRLLISA